MFYLNDYRKATCPLLAEFFKVSINTIRVDIEMLTCEYPIISRKGKYGGISVPDEWRYDRRYLSDRQDDLLRKLCAELDGEEKETMESILAAFSKKTQKRFLNHQLGW